MNKFWDTKNVLKLSEFVTTSKLSSDDKNKIKNIIKLLSH